MIGTTYRVLLVTTKLYITARRDLIMVSMSTIKQVFGTLQKKSWWQQPSQVKIKNVTQFVLSCRLNLLRYLFPP